MNNSQPNVLFLTKYTRTGASSRYRTYQYLPHLEQAGIHCEVSPLFDDAYLANLYRRGRGSTLDLLRAFLRRIRTIFKAHCFDLVVIEYELIPYFPALFERLLAVMGCRYLVDYDDALFHQYDLHHNSLVRALLGKKIATVMRHAGLVLAGNAYLADYARRASAKQVEVMPTVIDLDVYPLAPEGGQVSSPFVIGWLGSPTTAKYLQEIAPALAEVCQGGRALIRVIGAGAGAIDLPGVPVEVLHWDGSTEVAAMQTFDVGIMPLPDEPWARGKCGFKLIQYMACGLPVVASPVGVNCQIVEHGVNGFLAETVVEWETALLTLIADAGLRQRMGQAGRAKVEQQYCVQVTGPKLVELLKDAAISSGTRKK